MQVCCFVIKFGWDVIVQLIFFGDGDQFCCKVGIKYLGVFVVIGVCQCMFLYYVIYMDIFVSDKFCIGIYMICNNKIIVWCINVLIGMYWLIN